ncbi:hypothetical protein JS756_04830 [Streptomyces actuosus]|uniref:Uncharacterized protein n=1 Tax=Streptomyces actuosus TaxID=1885 RepID=A0ABS2VK10_STRAS|nr:hypothetical protein [Streptomyces actuosus]MBN0043435.1 hypothetical protein [Streptomyces actuosus]
MLGRPSARHGRPSYLRALAAAVLTVAALVAAANAGPARAAEDRPAAPVAQAR